MTGNDASAATAEPTRSDPDGEWNTGRRSMDRLINGVSAKTFDDWYRERQHTQNIENGTPYFNGPSRIKPPGHHNPSRLLQCHRKAFYNNLNAPAEEEDPRGIFWVGSNFEEDIALPFLRESVVGADEYVTNSIWIEFTEQTDAGEIQLKGETDPVVVDAEGEPLILTEIKTKKSVENLTSPNRHHKAQAHAYMKGLSEKYDRQIADTLFLYGSRETLDIEVFHVEFDHDFWSETVVGWASKQKSYQQIGELPPADPEYSWECNFCSYRERCGRGEMEFSSVGPTGLLPLYTDYPREKLVEYLEGHPESKLTPALANAHPTLAEEYGAFNWHCTACESAFVWDTIAWDTHSSKPPVCPECNEESSSSWLRGPDPKDQDHIEAVKND